MSGNRKKKSQLWNHFTPVSDGISTCNICHQKLSFKTSVSNLKKHLIKKHKDRNFQWTETSSQIRMITSDAGDGDDIHWTIIDHVDPTSFVTEMTDVPPVTASVDSLTQNHILPNKFDPSHHNYKNVNKMLMMLFVQDLQPLKIVEDSGFISLLQAFNSQYHLPDLHSLSTHIVPSMYERCLEDVKFMIRSEVETSCLTVNIWDTMNGDTYMELTAHYINSDFQFKTVLLECMPLSELCSSDHLASKLNHITDSWELTGKVTMAISNGATSISDAISTIDWKHFQCYAQTINSIVEEALSDSCVTTLLQKASKFVYYLNESDAAKELLLKHQVKEGVRDPKEILREGSSKWYLLYYMLQRLVELQSNIENSLQVFEEDVPLFSSEDWKSCRDLCLVLKPFQEASLKMSEEGYLTASLSIVMTRGLISVCKKLQGRANLTISVKAVVTKLNNGLSKSFSNLEFNQSLALCTFLDPRFKHHVFTNPGASESIIKHTIQLLSDVIKDDTLAVAIEAIEDRKEDDENLSIWEDVDTVISKALPQKTPTSRAALEVQRYMKDKVLERGESETCLGWWRKYANIYPHLSILFRRKCCIVSTSISCDNLYSESKRLLANRRAYLNESELKQLVFLNVNYNFSKTVKDFIF